MQWTKDMWVLSVIETIDEDSFIAPMKERLCVKALEMEIRNFNIDNIDEYDKMESALFLQGLLFL